MSSDEMALVLHDRSTRGQSLSTEERTILERWYAEQDQDEMAALQSPQGLESAVDIQRDIAEVLAQLPDVSLQIKEIITQNDAIRRENAALRHQVTVRFAGEVA